MQTLNHNLNRIDAFLLVKSNKGYDRTKTVTLYNTYTHLQRKGEKHEVSRVVLQHKEKKRDGCFSLFGKTTRG